MTPTVQATVWNWRQEVAAKTRSTANNSLRRQAVLQAVVMAAAGAVITLWWGHQVAGVVVWTLACCVLVVGLAAPRAYRHIHQFGQKVGLLVGQLLTYILLTPLYFIVFFPGALLLRLQGRDPMHRKLRDRNHTCWVARHTEPTKESYHRQFMIEDKAARGEQRPVGPSMPLGNRESS